MTIMSIKHLYYKLKKFIFLKPYVIVYYEINNYKFQKFFDNWDAARRFSSDCVNNPDIKNVSVRIK